MSSLSLAVPVSSHNAYFMSNTTWALVSCLLCVVQYLSLYIDVSSSRDEVFQQMQVAILCCDEEGRGSVDHLCVEVGAPAEKFLHHIQMITLTGHKQRGTPILIITPGLNITVTLKTTTFKSPTIQTYQIHASFAFLKVKTTFLMKQQKLCMYPNQYEKNLNSKFSGKLT